MPLRKAGLVFLLWVALPLSLQATEPLVVDRFEGDLSAWERLEFDGVTEYRLVIDQANRVLRADSRDSASGLVKRLEFDPNQYPRLRWRWKIAQTLAQGDARSKSGDDYAARIYVIFPHWLKPLTRTINYIWANRLPQGSAVPSAYYQRSMMLAVESGDQDAGSWRTEERNLVDDYRRLFGEDPPRVGGIAIMTDTDNTGASARAWYDDIVVLPPAE
jgi:hypothetical protein